MIRQVNRFEPTFALSNINDMSNVKYHHSAMEYATWYQEHLLQMEDTIGKRLESRIEDMIDRKIHEYMEKARNIDYTNNQH